ncbi:MAG: 4-vinyl reductase [Candidatus Aminicenantes bacterium]|nr:4-vinyl reductase [Candidatus Aminicenantes bacterium]
MAQEGNWIKWKNEAGKIKRIGDGKEERVFTISRDFIEEFKKELINTSGESTFRMIMRKLLEKLGTSPDGDTDVSWEAFARYNDEQILPAAADGLPKEYKEWDGKTRNLVLAPDIEMVMWTVKSFRLFKDVMAEVMTEKGANAIINSTGKKAGMAIGARFVKYFGWKDLQNATDTIDGIAQNMNPAAGWSKGGAVVQKDMILLKAWNSYEAEGKKSSIPVCTLTSSLLNGIWNTFAGILAGQSAESREVKCQAKGDDCCAFAIKIKAKGAPPLDWKELEAEWQALAG